MRNLQSDERKNAETRSSSLRTTHATAIDYRLEIVKRSVNRKWGEGGGNERYTHMGSV